MKQKVLGGATIVLSASDGKDNKDLDLSNVDDLGNIGTLEIFKDNNTKVVINDAKEKEAGDVKKKIIELIKAKSGTASDVEVEANLKPKFDAKFGELKLKSDNNKIIDITLNKADKGTKLEKDKLYFVISQGNDGDNKFRVLVIKPTEDLKIKDIKTLETEK